MRERYEAVIGLEIHAQLKTLSKIFCGCSTKFGAPPNTQTCPVCLGLPGVLPVLNKKAVNYAIMMALATHCNIEESCRFARKTYFSPDLPKGYQTSQYEQPLATNGWVMVEPSEGTQRIGIRRVHMEEDTGKLTHVVKGGQSYSLVDLNRSGVPLPEIVTEPELHSVEA